MFLIKTYKWTLGALLKALAKGAENQDKKSERSIVAAKAAEAVAIKLRANAADELAQANDLREQARKLQALI